MNFFEAFTKLNEIWRVVTVCLLLELVEPLSRIERVSKCRLGLSEEALGACGNGVVEVFGGQFAVVDRIPAGFLFRV